MYSRSVDGEPRTFGVSGKLWHSVLVMFDRESGSRWTQLDGRAIQGSDAGVRLEQVPSVFTTWEAWRARHPDTLVLTKAEGGAYRRGSRYEKYFADPEALRFPHMKKTVPEGIAPKAVVFGVRLEDEVLGVLESVLERDAIVHAEIAGRSVALLRDAVSGEVKAVELEHPGTRLGVAPGHEPTERVSLVGTGRIVDVDELPALRVDRAFWFAWAGTVPGFRLLAD